MSEKILPFREQKPDRELIAFNEQAKEAVHRLRMFILRYQLAALHAPEAGTLAAEHDRATAEFQEECRKLYPIFQELLDEVRETPKFSVVARKQQLQALYELLETMQSLRELPPDQATEAIQNFAKSIHQLQNP